ncbi:MULTISPECIES: TIGR03752 family integrating conjugative element protein [unclassified Serratia (in: enterobacteria)]|uniref:TIGR03752 family integrating conjugative element protein n=1 Tax=unclassified Serratia (in: enterobacteria) TaxID=2647522 RepID=UPI003075F9BC
MKSNGLLKWLMIPLVILLIFVGIKLFSGKGGNQGTGDSGPHLTAEEMKALGIEGDTPRDTVATLVGQVKQLRTELQGALGDNKAQKAENDRLRQREGAIESRIQSALDGERQRLQQDRESIATEKQQAQGLLQELQRRIDHLEQPGGTDLPVGLGLEAGDGKNLEGSNTSGLRWVEPEDARPADTRSGSSTGLRFPTRFGPAQTALEQPGEQVRHNDVQKKNRLKPVYTVPANATLMGSIAMTALIGRVPIDGTVNDPYPFKVLVGPDNLTANGIDLPDVAGAVISGSASGDWTLSCVRGQIRSITFVFNDGTVRTLPSTTRNSGEEESTARNSDSAYGEGLGWISDPHGIPCVSGERRSNAQQYLGSQALITAAGAGAASLIKSDNGNVAMVSQSDGSIGTVGISGNEAMGRILASGVQEMSQWVNKLYGQAFAAVYVAPGANVAVHIEHPLTIDYDPKGRRVDHRRGDHHALELD